MPIQKDPVLRLWEARRRETDEVSKARLQVGEKQAESQRRILDIRAKGHEAQRKRWNKYWASED